MTKIKVNGKHEQIKLAESDASYEEALERYHSVQANRAEDTPAALMTVAQIADEFLEWNLQNRAERTYEWYKRFLKPFVGNIGTNLRVSTLKPHHVDRWVKADYAKAKNNTRRNAIRAVDRCMNRAVKSGYFDANPIKGMERPPQESRETVISEEQYRQALQVTSDDNFRDFLTFLWETGCRAEEIVLLEAKHFDGELLTLTKKDSKGKKYNRVIYLNDESLEIVRRLAERYPNGPLFRNSKENAWNKNSIKCRFRLLKRELGIPDLCATTFRHTWATDVLTQGMDTTK